jgi:hypothetical protein
MTRRRSVVALVLALVLFASACGGDDMSGDIDRPATRALNEQIDLVEFAASAHDYDAARQGLVRLRTTANRFAERGSIDELRLAAILGAADDLDRSLAHAGG